MKWIIAASAFALATPALAQDMQTTPAPPANPAPMTQTAPTPMPDQPMAQPMAQPMQSNMPMQGNGTMTTGGYQPAQPPMMGDAPPGARVVFRPSPSVAEAYPAPAPLSSYPICKRGQTDKCKNRGE